MKSQTVNICHSAKKLVPGTTGFLVKNQIKIPYLVLSDSTLILNPGKTYNSHGDRL